MPWTRRELEILALIWDGHDYESIGHQLGIRRDEVRSHLFRMRAKAGAHSMTQLAMTSFKELHEWRRKSKAGLAAETAPGCYGCRYGLVGHFGNCDGKTAKAEKED